MMLEATDEAMVSGYRTFCKSCRKEGTYDEIFDPFDLTKSNKARIIEKYIYLQHTLILEIL